MTAFEDMLTAKSALTSAEVFSSKTDQELAYWLAEDARALDGQPGRNNHVAAVREAARRLHQRFEGREQRWVEFGKRMYELGSDMGTALSKIAYKKEDR